MHTRGDDGHRDQQTQGVGGDPAFTARASFPRVQAGGLPRGVGRGPHGLGVQHHRGRVRAATVVFPDLPAQQVMDRLGGSVVTPPAEVVAHRGGGGQVVGEVTPLAAGPGLVQDRVHDLPQRVAALMPARRGVPGFPRGQDRPDQFPRLIGQIAGVRLAFRHVFQQNAPAPERNTINPARQRSSQPETRRTRTEHPLNNWVTGWDDVPCGSKREWPWGSTAVAISTAI
ncbi:hypothetical protein CEDDRAFT_03838 [Frankia sp. CeD]|nr:hypothetical protein CEDDRAFT_03838 [Frankia sp. CeD]